MLDLNSIRVGGTPLAPVRRLIQGLDLYAKLEWRNPFGSVKDRAAYWMVKEAVESGSLRSGRVVIEPSSGNMGIALASIAKKLGLGVYIVVPEKVPEESKSTIRLIGAELIETPDDLCPRVGPGTDQCIAVAKSYVAAHPDKYVMLNQYENMANYKAHYYTTGPEIWADTGGRVDVFVAGVGTGGTLTGVAHYLKQRNPGVRVIGVQPQPSHHVPGLRNLEESLPPGVLKAREDLIDEWVVVGDDEVFEMVRRAYEAEGLYVGPSSGAVLAAIERVREKLRGRRVVTIFADSGIKYKSLYVSMGVFTEEEAEAIENGFNGEDPYTARLASRQAHEEAKTR